jgi:rubrerythrin
MPHSVSLPEKLAGAVDMDQDRCLNVGKAAQRPWSWPMERYVRRENIKHYKELLKRLTDPVERDMILKLIAEEEQKQRDAKDPIEE